MALFEVRGLRKAFGRHVVLDGLDIDIFAGETLTDDYARMNPARSTPSLRREPTCNGWPRQ